MKCNQILVISTCLASLYIGFSLYVFIALRTQNNGGDAGGLIAAIFNIFLIPSIILFSIGMIFGSLHTTK
ncbi:MAG: hypothetical protein FD133_1249 [Erysipelotrichaceae bacterium]|nr:MAG: hypothetical protein FD179_597 [Erysipelotrichaceae bacterium]TXT17710.1 MAG: hypothetical protein FD133_1249 [Erysipelotrichaceae bacterium]